MTQQEAQIAMDRDHQATMADPAALAVRSVMKRYGHHAALHEVNLRVDKGEFVTLLGSSGSGKTTLLRIVAGLAEPTGGTVSIDGRDVTQLPIEKRDIGFVFQNYALFPHLNVRDNISFGLKLRNYPREQLKARTQEMMELVHLSPLGSRFPGELSGGQQQRVAIARALAPSPKLLLLDEPLGALDRRLRQQLGMELKRIQRDTKVTSVYVTHDQEEAFLLSDKVAVMEAGRILQIDTPRGIYRAPRNLFVANFVGETCQMRGVAEAVSGRNGRVKVGSFTMDVVLEQATTVGSDVIVVTRPEQIAVNRCEEAGRPPDKLGSSLCGVVRSCTFLGNRLKLKIDACQVEVEAELDGSRDAEFKEGSMVAISWACGSARAYPVAE
jgi:ABC-type Fe3+/spermidine/putrescine transport system ATPase subunit